MSRYIDADELLKTCLSITITNNGIKYLDMVYKAIVEAPTADVREVKRGKWIEFDTESFNGYDNTGEPKWKKQKYFRCSECGYGSVAKSNYCPACGTRMDGKDD